MTDDMREPQPVPYDGTMETSLAHLARPFFDKTLKNVEMLRTQEQEYRDSLPVDPANCIARALGMLHPDAESYPKGLEEALHLSRALGAMVENYDFSPDDADGKAASWIAGRIHQSIRDTCETLDRMADVLANPKRLERERMMNELTARPVGG